MAETQNLPHLSAVTPGEDARTVMLNRVSWGAVFAGAAVALGAVAGWFGGRAGRVQPIVTSSLAGIGGRG